MKKFPILYKTSTTGKLVQWSVEVEGNVVTSYHGAVGGKLVPEPDEVREGKNIGRANETTPEQQAELEAQSSWEKKVKKGYVEDIERARAGEVDHDGGFVPMKAHVFQDHRQKIVYPAALQRKVDGFRCCSVVSNGNANLFSSERNEFIGVPHINAQLARLFPEGEFRPDGELYNHAFKENFEHLAHIVAQKATPDPDHMDVQLHVFDCVAPGGIMERLAVLTAALKREKATHIIPVETLIVNSEEELLALTNQFIDEGYEGSIVRNLDAPYEHRRSYGIQKVKLWRDAEFEVVGANQGRGKLLDSLATWDCVDARGRVFPVKPKGTIEMAAELWRDREKYIGRWLTVQYQTLTGKNGVPRFGVGLRFREAFELLRYGESELKLKESRKEARVREKAA